MTTAVPDFLKDEFSQAAWDELTPDEQAGLMSDDGEEENEVEEQQQDNSAAERAASDAEREEAARASAQPQKAEEESEPDQGADEQQPAEQQPEFSPQPRGIVDQVLPDDYEDRLAANARAIEDNDKAYDNGDISHEEWRTENRKLDRENRELDRIKDRAELAIESAQNAMRNRWEADISAFLPQHPEVSTSQVRQNAFDHFLREETAPIIQAGRQPGMKEIQAAHAKWCAEFGITPAKADPVAPKTTAQPAQRVPPSLGGLPAAESGSVEDGRFAAIDRLEGEAYEEALSKLSPAELDAYSLR